MNRTQSRRAADLTSFGAPDPVTITDDIIPIPHRLHRRSKMTNMLAFAPGQEARGRSLFGNQSAFFAEERGESLRCVKHVLVCVGWGGKYWWQCLRGRYNANS